VLKIKNRRKTNNMLMRIAIFYVLTNSEYELERLICCRRKGFNALLTYYISQVDAATKCCIDQMALSIRWLELRGMPRVQSTTIKYVEELKIFARKFPVSRRFRSKLNSICDPWIVDTFGFTKGMSVLTSRGSLGVDIY